MNKFVRFSKRSLALFIVAILNINTYATTTSNDGSAFVTKAEFDTLMEDFNKRIDTYKSGINSKIDTAIANYLAGLSSVTLINLPNSYENATKNKTRFMQDWSLNAGNDPTKPGKFLVSMNVMCNLQYGWMRQVYRCDGDKTVGDYTAYAVAQGSSQVIAGYNYQKPYLGDYYYIDSKSILKRYRTMSIGYQAWGYTYRYSGVDDNASWSGDHSVNPTIFTSNIYGSQLNSKCNCGEISGVYYFANQTEQILKNNSGALNKNVMTVDSDTGWTKHTKATGEFYWTATTSGESTSQTTALKQFNGFRATFYMPNYTVKNLNTLYYYDWDETGTSDLIKFFEGAPLCVGAGDGEITFNLKVTTGTANDVIIMAVRDDHFNNSDTLTGTIDLTGNNDFIKYNVENNNYKLAAGTEYTIKFRGLTKKKYYVKFQNLTSADRGCVPVINNIIQVTE